MFLYFFFLLLCRFLSLSLLLSLSHSAFFASFLSFLFFPFSFPFSFLLFLSFLSFLCSPHLGFALMRPWRCDSHLLECLWISLVRLFVSSVPDSTDASASRTLFIPNIPSSRISSNIVVEDDLFGPNSCRCQCCSPAVMHTTRSTCRHLGLPWASGPFCASTATFFPALLPPLVVVPNAAFESVRVRSVTRQSPSAKNCCSGVPHAAA